MSVLGTLEIQLMADVARIRKDMDAAKGVVGSAMQNIQGAASMAGKALGALGVGLSLGALAAFVKQGIAAADMANELAQKTGLATTDVAGLQLAFKQGGLAGDAMGNSLAKMAKQMVEGNAAFDTLGIKTRNADGSLRSTKAVLYDTAEAFAGIKDGAGKTALAMEIFGKSGADMIPVLNGGAEGLREMAEMAQRLGLEIDEGTGKAADQFNDQIELLGMGMKGVSTQVAAQLLPTLTSLSASFLESMTSGDALRKGANVLASALKILYSAGLIGVEIFNTLGKSIGGAAAAIVAVAQGEFRQAANIIKETGSDIKQGWSNTAATVARAWDTTGNATVQAMAGMAKGQREVTLQSKAQEDAAKKAAAAAAKHTEEILKLTKAGDDLLKSMVDRVAMTEREITLGRQLTAAEKEHLDLTIKLREGKLLMTAAVEAEARAQIDLNEQKAKHRAIQISEQALLAEMESDRQAMIASLQKETLSLGDQVNKQREQNLEVQIGAAGYAALLVQRMRDRAGQIEQTAATSDQSAELREQARLLRERATLTEQGVVLQEAKAAADEWKKTTESIKNGLTDALMRAFESGSGFLDAFRDTLKNAFQTLILQPMVKGMVADLSGGLQSVMGSLSGLLSGSTGIGSVVDATGGMETPTEGANNVAAAGAAAFVPYIGWIIAAIQQAKSDHSKGFTRDSVSNSSSIGSYSGVVHVADALTNLLGVNKKWADILSGATSVAKLIGHGTPNVTAQGLTGSFGGGTFQGQLFQDWRAKGGWFRSDKTGTNTGKLDDALGAQLNRSAGDILAQTRAYAAALALPVSALVHVTSTARVELGDDAEKNATAIAAALGLYSAALVKDYEGALAGVSQPGEAATDTLARLGEAMLTVNSTFEALGLHLVRTSVAGGAAAAELVSLTGGLDAFMAKTQSYLAAYFTQAEQMGLGAGGVLQTLQAAGIDFSAATTRDDLRRLMEGLDPNLASDREQMATLLTVAGDFAKIADYLAENKLTLGELASQAPKAGLLAAVSAADVGPHAQQQTDTVDGLSAIGDSVMTIGDRITDAVHTLQSSVEQGLAAIATATQATLRQLQGWDNNGQMSTTTEQL